MGALANLIIPMRGGELARIYLLASRGGLGTGRATAIIVLERMVDLVAMLCLVSAAAVVIGLPEGFGTGLDARLGAVVIIVLIIVSLLLFRSKLPVLSSVFENRGRLGNLVARILGRVAEGAELLRSWRAALAALAVLTSWSLVLLGLVLRIEAFHIELPPGGSLLVFAAGNLSTTIQVAPGGLGVFEYAIMLCLEHMGIDSDIGLAFALTSHGLSLAAFALAGALSVGLDGVLGRRVSDFDLAPGRPGR